MTTAQTSIYSGSFVKITSGRNKIQKRNTYWIQTQDGLSDGSYPADDNILARELDRAAAAIRSHRADKNPN